MYREAQDARLPPRRPPGRSNRRSTRTDGSSPSVDLLGRIGPWVCWLWRRISLIWSWKIKFRDKKIRIFCGHVFNDRSAGRREGILSSSARNHHTDGPYAIHGDRPCWQTVLSFLPGSLAERKKLHTRMRTLQRLREGTGMDTAHLS